MTSSAIKKRAIFNQKSSPQNANRLRHLAAQFGVAASYVDEGGARRLVNEQSLRRILSVMEIEADDSTHVTERMREVRSARWRTMLDPVMVVKASRLPRTFSMRLPVSAEQLHEVTLRWRFKKERGGVLLGRRSGKRVEILGHTRVDRIQYCEVALPFPRNVPCGYHSLTVEVGGPDGRRRDAMTVITVPDHCYRHPAIIDSRRTWGVTIQLYGLRSKRNWGIGDFRDLKEFIQWAGKTLDADVVGVNPLHALPPGQASPYSPSSRLFHNALYLDIEGIPEFRDMPSIHAKVKTRTFQATLESLRRSPTV